MGRKRDLESELNEFLSIWNQHKVAEFLRDIIPLFVLYHIDKNGTEFNEFTGEEEECTIRVLRTVYLLSRLAHIHAGELCLLNAHFKNLWIRMEKETQQKNVTPIMKELANIANEIPKDDT